MKAIDFICNARQFSDKSLDAYLDDMRDAPLVQPTPRGGNHPLWVAGHLAGSEAALRGMITGKSDPHIDWSDLFAPGSEPTADEMSYPQYDEVVAEYRKQRDLTRKLIDALDDADLDQEPSAVPAELKQVFGTVADVLMLIVLHQEFHQGQIADARRAIGRPRLFTLPESISA